MNRKCSVLLVLICCIAIFSYCKAYCQITVKDLPDGVRAMLDSKYPHWSLPKETEEVARYHKQIHFKAYTNIIRGDFDGNGGSDYAVRFTYGREPNLQTALVAFMKRSNGYKEIVIGNSAGAAKPNWCLYLFRKGGKNYDRLESKYFIYQHDSIGVISPGKSGASYIFKNGKFELLVTPDAPSHGR
jgi:hypothetical protein